MKTVISFMTVQSENDNYEVYFSIGEQVYGAYELDIQIKVDNPKLIAELAVMRHVLLNSGLIKTPCAESISLQCSQGAIKKLIRKTSAKLDANDFARFLTIRFSDVEIKVKHDKSLINKNSVVKKLIVNNKPLETEKTIVGDVKLTEHAVSRFQQRFHPDKQMGEVAQILINELRSRDLKNIDVDHKKRSRSIVKHQRDAQYWSNGQACFVMVPQRNHQALVTVLPQQAA